MTIHKDLVQVLSNIQACRKEELKGQFSALTHDKDSLPWARDFQEFKGYFLCHEGWSWDGWAYCSLVFLTEQVKDLGREALFELANEFLKRDISEIAALQSEEKYTMMNWSLD